MSMKNLSLVAINIIAGENHLLNKNGVPIVLYTTAPEEIINTLSDTSTETGKTLHTFIVNNVVRPTYNNDLQMNLPMDLYRSSVLNYIYYDPNTKQSVSNKIPIQSLFTLNIKSDDADVIFLTFFYLRKAVLKAWRGMNFTLSNSVKESISNMTSESELNVIYESIRKKYNEKILANFRWGIIKELQSSGINDDNINRIVYIS